MGKKTIAAVIACVLGIVVLAALAILIMNTKDLSGSALRNILPVHETPLSESELFQGFIYETEDASPAVKEDAEMPQTEAERMEAQAQTEPSNLFDETGTLGGVLPGTAGSVKGRAIFVGDSRTLGMRDAMRRQNIPDQSIYVGRVGEGVRWFVEEGIEEMEAAIEENPDLPVVLNLGVNDPEEIDRYIVTYWDCIRNHPDTDFYILSVNPMDEEFMLDGDLVADGVLDHINTLNIAIMNNRLKEEFPSRYIDCASYLRANGYETVDGLHFNTQTYLRIHDFVLLAIS